MKHYKYSDQLLAQQDTLSTNTIFEILLGYSWHELSKAEDLEKELIRLEELGFKHTEEKVHAFRKEWITKTTEKAVRAKQAAGTNLGRMKYPHAIPTKTKGNKILDNRISEIRALTPELRAASKAYTVLKKWMGIMFHNDPSGLSLDQSYMTVRFFAWIIVDNILEKLEEGVNDFKAPARANEFIGYLTLKKDTKLVRVSSQIDKETKTVSTAFFPAPKGTTWDKVKIVLIANDTVQVTIKDRSERCSYHELGMSDKRKGDKPKIMWWFLVRLIKEEGYISKIQKQYDPKLIDVVKGFRKQMKNLFGVEDSPLGHYKTEKGYRARFRIGDQTQISLKELINLPNPIDD